MKGESTQPVKVRPKEAHPDAEWVTQRARQVAWTLAERAEPVRFVIRDHDRKFTSSFDGVFQMQDSRIIRTPIQVPQANGIAERFVRTVRSEGLDWLLVANARHLERALTVFISHYNGHRAHRSLNLEPPNGRPPTEKWAGRKPIIVNRRDRLGGSCMSTSVRRELSRIEFVYRTRNERRMR